MNDQEEKLAREVTELKAEIDHIKLLFRWAVAILLIGLIILIPSLFPSLLRAFVFVGIAIPLCLLISPARGFVFPSVFKNRNTRGTPPNSPPSDFHY
jgi:hypothetical protein